MSRNPIDTTRHLLRQIPRLHAELPSTRYMARLRDDTNIRTSVAGSRPPLDLTLLDLKDGRDIQWWLNQAVDEMIEAGVEPENVPSSRRPDITEQCRWLADNTPWIADNNPAYHAEIKSLHWMYRRAAGHHDAAKLKCLTCGNRAFIDGIWFICTEVEEHARTLKDIEQGERFRAKETTEQICARFSIEAKHLYDWRRYGKNGRRIRPVEKVNRTLLWWPWDVFCLLNPAVADAIEARDENQEPA